MPALQVVRLFKVQLINHLFTICRAILDGCQFSNARAMRLGLLWTCAAFAAAALHGCKHAQAGALPPAKACLDARKAQKSDNAASEGISASSPKRAVLHIRITGITEKRGVIRLALYDSEQGYDSRKGACRSRVIPVEHDTEETSFRHLHPGWYAVMMYHDKNNNNECDRVLGLPGEPFGISNNVRPGITGAPPFEKARFHLGPGEELSIEIRLESLL